MLAPCPTHKLEDHPSSAVRGCLFNLFTATLHIGGRSSIRNLRTRHAVVTGTHIHGYNRSTKHKFPLFCISYVHISAALERVLTNCVALLWVEVGQPSFKEPNISSPYSQKLPVGAHPLPVGRNLVFNLLRAFA